MDLTSLTSKPTADLIDVLPKLGVVMALSSLCKQNATRRNGVQPWQIDRTINDCIQSLQVNQANQSTGLLPTLQQVLGAQQPVQPTVDPLQQQISKSLHAIHKRQDASDELLAKIADKLEL